MVSFNKAQTWSCSCRDPARASRRPPLSGALSCNVTTGYAIDMWVNRADIRQNGLRNFKLGNTTVCCSDPDGPPTGFEGEPTKCTPFESSKSLTTGVGNVVTVDVNHAFVDT